MAQVTLSKAINKRIDSLVEYYKSNQDIFNRVAKNINNLFIDHPKIYEYIHSIKYRVKDPSHLKNKLIRKAIKCKIDRSKFDINEENLFEKIQDLSGVRILHLHTEQMKDINPAIHEILDDEQYKIIEGPVASTWDDEYKTFYKSLGITTRTTDSMYTSVHYIIEINNKSQTKCELQVRTLMEEVWGEVSHQIDYPEKSDSISCREQLKVLARVTSSGTRLVDSIIKSHDEYLKYKSK